MTCKCGHRDWDHYVEEVWTGEDKHIFFVECAMDDCDCDGWEEQTDD